MKTTFAKLAIFAAVAYSDSSVPSDKLAATSSMTTDTKSSHNVRQGVDKVIPTDGQKQEWGLWGLGRIGFGGCGWGGCGGCGLGGCGLGCGGGFGCW